MAELRIPSDHQAVVIQVAHLGQPEFDRFLAALSQAPKAFLADEIRAEIEARLEDAVQNPGAILETLITMSAVRALARQLPADFAADLSQSRDLKLKDDERLLLKRRLDEVLSQDALAILSKARELEYEQGNAMHSARVLTDIRPVFRDDPNEGPAAGVLLHTLKLDYHTDGRILEFYVGLDSADIKELMATLERAESKAAALKSIVGNWIEHGSKEEK